MGGSVEDNLFQIADIEAHLDLLHSVGGNYVRCTMSSRDEGDAWPFDRDPETYLYDLAQPGTEYWTRFERFLKSPQGFISFLNCVGNLRRRLRVLDFLLQFRFLL